MTKPTTGASPRASRRKPASILEAAYTPPEPLNTEQALQASIAEAMEGELTTPDAVTVAGLEVPVTFLPYGYERKMAGIISPYLKRLTDTWLSGDEDLFLTALMGAMMSATSINNDLGKLASLIMSKYHPQATVEWLDENARMGELTALVMAQVAKNKIADELGKLWGRGAVSVRLIAALNISTPQTGQATTQP